MRLLIPLLTLLLVGCSTTPDAVRLSPQFSGGWRKDNLLVLYSAPYPSTQEMNILISNAQQGWEKIDIRHVNGTIIDILSHSKQLKKEKSTGEQRLVDSYLSLQLEPDETLHSVAYWEDGRPAIWPTEQLKGYQRLFLNTLTQGGKLAKNKQRLWMGYYALQKEEFVPCQSNIPVELNIPDELHEKLLPNWHRSQQNDTIWLTFIGSSGEEGSITLQEELLVHPPQKGYCQILSPIGRRK